MSNEERICRKLAEMYQGRDWHRLRVKERELVADLEQAGWLDRAVWRGFVGAPTQPQCSTNNRQGDAG